MQNSTQSKSWCLQILPACNWRTEYYLVTTRYYFSDEKQYELHIILPEAKKRKMIIPSYKKQEESWKWKCMLFSSWVNILFEVYYKLEIAFKLELGKGWYLWKLGYICTAPTKTRGGFYCDKNLGLLTIICRMNPMSM